MNLLLFPGAGSSSTHSSLLAIERCEAVGLKVKRVLAIIDRLEGGREAFAAKGYELTTLFTIQDFEIGNVGSSVVDSC